jgi:hypothetical protein
VRRLAATVFCIFILAGVLVGQKVVHLKNEWNAQVARQIQIDRARFERIQRYHGAVAVATDWSHALRLNGERIDGKHLVNL